MEMQMVSLRLLQPRRQIEILETLNGRNNAWHFCSVVSREQLCTPFDSSAIGKHCDFGHKPA
jgi:hypothetical protein